VLAVSRALPLFRALTNARVPSILRLGAIAAASIVAACAPATRLPYRADQPPIVTLPLAHAGVRDERAAFATLFEREWRTAPRREGDTTIARWLHGVGGAGTTRAASPADLARIDAAFAARASNTTVLIVPGLFGDCVAAQSVPFGDGVLRASHEDPRVAYRAYADLGLRDVRLLPVPGRGSTATNARLLADAIRAEAARTDRTDRDRIVLVGYSKGVPDLLEALALLNHEGGVPAKVKAVVSVAGAVMGTPLADHYRSAYEALSPHVTPLDCTPSRGAELASLTRHDRVAWLATHALPPGIAWHSIIAHASVDEMAPPLRYTARELAAVDARNDGQLVASDAVLPHGTLLAEVRADHWDVALPRDRHPEAIVRALTSQRGYPREALFRALVRWVVGMD
jgi:hypothetical protein